MVGGYIESRLGGGWWGFLESTTEETLEMAGMVLYIYTLLSYMSEYVPRVTISISATAKGSRPNTPAP